MIHRNDGLHQAGFTLIELIVVVGFVAIIMSTLAIVFRGVFGVDQHVRNVAADVASCQRLLTRFRDDVHAATAFELDDTDAALLVSLTLPGRQRVEYSRDGGHVIRTAWELDRRLHRDTFWLPRDGTLDCGLDEDGLLRLTVATASGDFSLPATAGRDHPTIARPPAAAEEPL